MPPIPDLVRLSKLDTQFSSSPEYTEHIRYVSGSALERKKVRKEERWRKERRLGRGSFGDVWLQQCVYGDKKDQMRAVKEILKLQDNNYYRELEAIALFSHDKYEQCFVKSYGWYDDDYSIFITMEYLPNGDLQKHLSSPLPESEGQTIVAQTLEGDLKPANILVVRKGPDWWVKIADFGISKRTAEESTALRTQTGTRAFAAPEVFFPTESDSYTNAVDIWSLGVITFLTLTGETLFKDRRRLDQYVTGRFAFPSDLLLANKVSRQGCEFIRGLMAPKSEDRPGAEKSLQSPWLAGITELAALEIQRITNASKPLPEILSSYSEAEASASWSTHDLSYRPYRSSETLTPKADLRSPPLLTTENQSSAFKSDSRESVLPPRSAIAEPLTKVRTRVDLTLPAILKGHSNSVLAVAFSPNSKQIASASSDETVRLWDTATGAAGAILTGHSDVVWAVAFSPDGKQIASTSHDQTVRLWDTATGATSAILTGHSDVVWAVAFSPDGKQIVSTSRDQTVRLWDAATGAAGAILTGHSDWIWAVAFSPDGKQIASVSKDQTVRLWDAATGAAGAILTGHSNCIRAVAFSPDGKQIASASKDQTVRLWDAATGAAGAILKGHSDWVWAVAFSPNGKQIASASHDQTVRLWDAATRAGVKDRLLSSWKKYFK